MATTTKKYLDLNGLQYVLSQLKNVDAAVDNQFVTAVTEDKGRVSVTRRALALADVPFSTAQLKNLNADPIASINSIVTGTITNGTKIQIIPSLVSGAKGDTAELHFEHGTYTTVNSIESDMGVRYDINDSKITKATGASFTGLTNLSSQGYVDEQINTIKNNLSGGVVYIGATSVVPETPAKGYMYKLSANIPGFDTLFSTDTVKVKTKAGDAVIYSGTSWDLIPAGDDVEYTGVKVGSTQVISETAGGTVEFAGGTDVTLNVSGKKVTIGFKHQNAVTSIDTKYGAFTLKKGGTANGDVNLSVNDSNQISASIVGLKSGAFKDYFTHPTVTAVTTAALKKIKVDANGHVTETSNATASDLSITAISGLTGSNVQTALESLNTKIGGIDTGVTSLDGAIGVITTKKGGTANGDINLAVTDGQLAATIVGLKSAAFTESSAYQAKFTDGSATIVTTAADSTIQTAGATNTTTTTIKNVGQTGGKIQTGAEAVIFATISNKEIDDIFA